MDRNATIVLFALIRSAVFDIKMTEAERNLFSDEMLTELYTIAQKHCVSHLVAYGLRKNLLIKKDDVRVNRIIFRAALHYEQLNHELVRLCEELEKARIPFIPLKGSVLCQYYPEPWMRSRCDIDVLVRPEDLDRAILYLEQVLQYGVRERATHDVLLVTPGGQHIELHYDLVEEGRANRANEVLKEVWRNTSLRDGHGYWHEMSDAFYYFYHIAHMAKHFETGGCGIRPYIDLCILDGMDEVLTKHRDELLQKGELLRFAQVSRRMSQVWFMGEKSDALVLTMQDFLLHGGAFGTADNRVALQQQNKGGRSGYILSRVFIPYAKLKRYYPVLGKYPWLMPVMQVRRWSMLLKPDVAKRTKCELNANANMRQEQAKEMKTFLDDIGLGRSL